MGLQYKAANIKAPVSDGTNAGSNNQRFYTCDNTTNANALPDAWAGKYIEIINTGSVGVWYYISTSSGANISNSPTAAASGTLAANPERLGSYIGAGLSAHIYLPSLVPAPSGAAAGPAGATTINYLVRGSASSSPLLVRLASD